MSVRRVWAHHIRLPFRRRYRHAMADRRDTEGIILEVEVESGHHGFGEALPRAYVTGETIESVIAALADGWASQWAEAPTSGYDALLPWLEQRLDAAVADRTLCVYGAVELALLDAVGQATRRSAADCLTPAVRRNMQYTGPISAGTVHGARRLARLMRLGGLRELKVKVGFDNDVDVVAAVRDAAGRQMDIRIDANGAWTPAEAIARMAALAPCRVSAVEQPVAADDVAGMAEVQAAIAVPVVADESACTVEDVQNLADAKACQMVNVRVGKCGGLLGARRVAAAAERCDLAWHVGCLVGETALLSAAGRHFAFGVNGWCHAEGSYGPFLLKRDIAIPQPRWGWRGSARPIGGPGLGVRVERSALAALTVETRDLL